MAWTDAARRAAAEARRRRASETFKPSTQAKQLLAAKSEVSVAKMLRAARTRNNAAMDTILKRHGLHGIEVKTLIDNKNDKITMHPSSLLRKLEWAKANKASLHTVVVDRRGTKPRLFYRAGVGSFRLRSLTPIKGGVHLRSLIGG
jgi:hypothetical protein